MDRRELWLWFVTLPRIFSPKITPLIERFGSVGALYHAGEQELRGINGIGEAELASLINKDLSKAKKSDGADRNARCAYPLL